jgi:uncharacterized membrane protein YfcA
VLLAAITELPLLGMALAIFAGIYVQAAVGFGAGLFAVPLLVWTGLPLPVAIATLLSVVFFQTGWHSWQYRHVMPKAEVRALILPRLIGTPIGIWLLSRLGETAESQLQALLGLFLLVVVLVQAFARVRTRPQLPGYWVPLVGGSSGLFAGLFGMGGPPLVLWSLAHDWSPAQARSFLWGCFFVLSPVQLGLYAWSFGPPAWEGMLVGVLLSPILFLASWLGERSGRGLSRVLLRRLAFALLVALALRTIVAAW